MDKKVIEKYIKERGKVTRPEVQKEFSLGYKKVRALFSELEKEGVIRLEEDLFYVYCGKQRHLRSEEEMKRLKNEIDSKPSLYKEVVGFCAENRIVSVSILQAEFCIGFNQACEIVEWLTEQHIVLGGERGRKIVIFTEEDYCEMYDKDEDEGDGEDKDNGYNKIENDEEERDRIIEARERLARRRDEILRKMREQAKEDDEDEDDDDEDGGDTEEEDDE